MPCNNLAYPKKIESRPKGRAAISQQQQKERETWESSSWTLPPPTLLLCCCQQFPRSLTSLFLSFPLSPLPNSLLSQASLTHSLNFTFCLVSKKRKGKNPEKLIRFFLVHLEQQSCLIHSSISPSVWSLSKPRKID